MTPALRTLRPLPLFPMAAAIALISGGCGGAAPAPAAAPPPASTYQDESAPRGSAPAEAPHAAPVVPLSPPTTALPVPPPPPPAPGADQPADAPGSRTEARIVARADLDRAQRDLESAANDCESACRALASMERATSHLCSLAEVPDDQRRCEDAKLRLTAARGRVRAACGACR